MTIKVRMINSVDEHVAGEEVDLPDDLAKRFIVLGYAEGDLGAEVPEEEQAEIRASANVQEVSV